VFDERIVGNGWLLPAGPLREPWPRDVDLIVASGELPPGANGYRVRRTLDEAALRQDGTRVPLRDLSRKTASPQPRHLLAVAGIAQPQAFFAMLRARGLTLEHTAALPDHADFTAQAWLIDTRHTVLCTEKDAVKLWRHRPDALAVPLVVTLEAPFWRALEQMLATRSTDPIRAKLSSAHGHSPTRPAGLPGHEGPAGI
jgi:tetraacyldisaccharide 4'-kinase